MSGIYRVLDFNPYAQKMEGKTAFQLGKENIEGRSLLTGHSGIGPEIIGGIIDICGTGLPKT